MHTPRLALCHCPRSTPTSNPKGRVLLDSLGLSLYPCQYFTDINYKTEEQQAVSMQPECFDCGNAIRNPQILICLTSSSDPGIHKIRPFGENHNFALLSLKAGIDFV